MMICRDRQARDRNRRQMTDQVKCGCHNVIVAIQLNCHIGIARERTLVPRLTAATPPTSCPTGCATATS
jgi:hypothetical protein